MSDPLPTVLIAGIDKMDEVPRTDFPVKIAGLHTLEDDDRWPGKTHYVPMGQVLNFDMGSLPDIPDQLIVIDASPDELSQLPDLSRIVRHVRTRQASIFVRVSHTR
jgi:hypothetical protein